MTPKLRNLLVVIGLGVGGAIGGRAMYAPGPDTTLAQLVDAGIQDCPLRTVRCLVKVGRNPIKTREAVVRVCDGEPIFRTAPPANATIFGCRAVGAGVAEADLADITHECACRATAGGVCTAVDGRDGQTKTLPLGMLAGPGYEWTSPTGAGCVAAPCMETNPGESYPGTCTR